jgi:DNA-binding CsgD family transcriptional regulator
MLKAQQSFDARDWLSNLKVPSLIVQPHSPWSVSSATEIAAAIPGARLQRVEELGNMLHASEDEPSPGVAAIVEFVAGLPGAAIEVPEQPNGTPAQHEGLDTLSPRQREVLRLIGQGKTNREIAGDLVISARTVERHLADIYAKTGVRNRAQAAVFAKEIDLV